ncbi:hypothetical protein AJ78_00851 [Emergomyces pasteurianus Ep9510]|uniref:Uncharacterized protein n=1 Tax=Emergomyces pasteurianus Ep9510 TaxID=1447872 RepID=A0A1J9QSH5_9EURO|nr:hypothetical protein AJ78_00851 [Emergomyces pasteurianus Ep9510]
MSVVDVAVDDGNHSRIIGVTGVRKAVSLAQPGIGPIYAQTIRSDNNESFIQIDIRFIPQFQKEQRMPDGFQDKLSSIVRSLNVPVDTIQISRPGQRVNPGPTAEVITEIDELLERLASVHEGSRAKEE